MHADLPVSVGTQRITIGVIAGVSAGNTVIRYRLSTQQSLGPNGEAVDGEVEDYLVTLVDPGSPIDLTYPAQGSDLAVSVINGTLQLRDGDFVPLTAPAAGLKSLTVTGTPSDDVYTLEDERDPVQLRENLIFQGGDGLDSIVVDGPGESNVDITASGNLRMEGFERFDLEDGSADVLRLDAASITSNGGSRVFQIQFDSEDMIEFADVGSWSIDLGRVINGRPSILAFVSPDGPDLEMLPESVWQNFLNQSDVNNNGDVTAGDALVIINELARRAFSDGQSSQLATPDSLTQWPGVYFDQNGDGSVTALDALRVINELARITNGSGQSGELVAAPAGRSRAELSRAKFDLVDQAIMEAMRERSPVVRLASFESPSNDDLDLKLGEEKSEPARDREIVSLVDDVLESR